MKTSTRNAVIGAIATVITAILAFFAGDKIGINQTINIINDGEEKKIDAEDYENLLDNNNQMLKQKEGLENENENLNQKNEQLNEDISKLQEKNKSLVKENNELSNQIEKLKNSMAQNDNSVSDQSYETVYLNNLSVFNCQYYDRGTWESANLYEWSNTDKAADGKKYKNATHMAIDGNWSGHAQTIVIDYLLDKKYKTINGNFILDENSKSTTTIATLNIYGDDTILYTYDNITGGLVPQNTGEISIKNIDKLRFEFVSEQGELGNYSDHFGVVFFDTILK